MRVLIKLLAIIMILLGFRETKTVVKEPIKEEKEETLIQEQVQEEKQEQIGYTTRMTSFYPEEGETITGSGLTPSDFGINDNGWFTYNGKLVVATATIYLANKGWYVGEGVHLRKYYDEIILNIDGTDYEAIVLDSCGNCMKTDRVDLYVSSIRYIKDTMVEVKEK